MGTYFNPENESYKKAIRSAVYIDKTGLLAELNALIRTESNCISISHARRFGKSQAAAMVDAYYSLGSDSKELFSRFEIAKKPDFEDHLNKYNVIHLDISSFADFYKDDLVSQIIRYLYDEFKVNNEYVDYSKSINSVLMQIYTHTQIPFVIIIDEWDCVVRNYSDRPDLVHEYLQFLHSIFKSEESKTFLALAYITGILPIKKIRDESALNNFTEYTMIESDNLTRYFGFTEEEVQKLCEEYNMPYDSIGKWYDGYEISRMHMYNPNSVYNAMVRKRLDSYWKNTSSFETINNLINLNYEGLKDDIVNMLSGERVPVNVGTFKNDLSTISCKDDALTALIHLGYLAYDSKYAEAFIPNYEVSLAYSAALKTGNYGKISKAISTCEELLRATIRKNADRVAELIELAHDSYSSILKYNDENSVSSVIQLAYFTAPAYYNMIREFPTGKGFADFAFIPRKDTPEDIPAMVIEVKWNEDADTAISQIKERRYAGNLKGYSKEILLVGINYNKEIKVNGKHHECKIETVTITE